jgi:DNA anti-recombination protein RmuC
VERSLWTDERLDDMVDRIEKRFDDVDRRFDAVDRRFEAVDRRFDRLETKIDDLRRDMFNGFLVLFVAILGMIGTMVAHSL